MKAFITGIAGQSGSYLAELLLEKGYEVHGLIRRSSIPKLDRIKNIANRLTLHEGDLTDYSNIANIIRKLQPDECYNLAAQSQVGTSFNEPYHTFHVDTIGHLNILESVRLHSAHTKVYFAGTSECWGNNFKIINGKKCQDLSVPFSARSPYGAAKIAGVHLTKLYRESYNIFAVSGLLHNHESPRRGEYFVTRKITKWLGELVNLVNNGDCAVYTIGRLFDNSIMRGRPVPGGDRLKLRLGNIHSHRDFGHAKDYICAAYMMLQNKIPKDYTVGTGVSHSVQEFLDTACNYVGFENYKDFIIIDESLFRPAEVDYLCANPFQIQNELGWKPEYTFEKLVQEMVDSDIEAYEKRKR